MKIMFALVHILQKLYWYLIQNCQNLTKFKLINLKFTKVIIVKFKLSDNVCFDIATHKAKITASFKKIFINANITCLSCDKLRKKIKVKNLATPTTHFVEIN